jgi:hypothetical protein
MEFCIGKTIVTASSCFFNTFRVYKLQFWSFLNYGFFDFEMTKLISSKIVAVYHQDKISKVTPLICILYEFFSASEIRMNLNDN